MVESFSTRRSEPARPPNSTRVAPLKWEPVMVTGVPPATGPLPGETAPILGART